MRDTFIAWGMVLVAMAFILGVVVGATLGIEMGGGPNCPQEDSCRADYHDGAWHIIEVTP